MYKTKHHIPTEEYGFTEIEFEGEGITYGEAKKLVKLEETLKDPEFNKVLDKYVIEIKTGSISVDEYEGLNPIQKDLFQVIKRLTNRKNG